MTSPNGDYKVIVSRDQRWEYHQATCGRIHAVIHRPTGTRINVQTSLRQARACVRDGCMDQRVRDQITERSTP